MTEKTRAAKRRDRILSLVPAGGATVEQIAAALGVRRDSAESRLRLYAKAGHLFMARVRRGNATHAEGWYFRDEAERDAVEAQCKVKAAPEQPAEQFKGMEATNPNNVQPKEVPSVFRHRHSADPSDVPPLFSSLRPGQYIAPAPAWLAGVAP